MRVEGGGLQPVSEAEGEHRRRPRRPAARRRRPRRNELYDPDARLPLPLHGVAAASDGRGEGTGLYDHREDAGENVNAIESELFRETVGELEGVL